METTSLLNKVNWLLATSVIVLIATLAMGSALFVSCDPAKSEEITKIDYTKEQLIARENIS